MKKFLLVSICLLLVSNIVFSSETKWQIVNDVDLYKISSNGINYEKKGEILHSGTVVTGISSATYFNEATNIEMVEILNNEEYYVDINSVKLLNSNFVFEDDILSANLSKKNFFLISDVYFQALKQKNRDLLCEIEKNGFHEYEKNKFDMDYEWYQSRFYYNRNEITNITLNFINIFSSYDFMIQEIERKENQYLVKVEVDNCREFENKGYTIPNKGDVIEISIKRDGDYVIVDYANTNLGTYVITDKQTSDQIKKFIRKNECDYSQVTWPRHANGNCDYETNKALVANFTSATNVSLLKEMSVSESLKLRSGEATSTQVLTVMSAGTKVKILEIGKEETIDEIKSNWVKVEVLSGNDKECKKLKCGMTGWCYGGYLQ